MRFVKIVPIVVKFVTQSDHLGFKKNVLLFFGIDFQLFIYIPASTPLPNLHLIGMFHSAPILLFMEIVGRFLRKITRISTWIVF